MDPANKSAEDPLKVSKKQKKIKALIENISPDVPMNLKCNNMIRSLDQGIYGEFFHSNLGLTELYFLDEFFEPIFVKTPDPKIEELLNQSSKTRGELTDFLCIDIETYMQEGTGNGAKGISRVVIIN